MSRFSLTYLNAWNLEVIPIETPAVTGGLISMIDVETFTDKIAESGRRIIRKAYEEAKTRDHNQLAPEHLFLSITEVERPFFNEVMQSLNLDSHVVIQALLTKLDQKDYLGRGMKISESLRILLSNASTHANRAGESSSLLICFLRCSAIHTATRFELLRRLGADREMVMKKIATCIRSHEEKEDRNSSTVL